MPAHTPPYTQTNAGVPHDMASVMSSMLHFMSAPKTSDASVKRMIREDMKEFESLAPKLGGTDNCKHDVQEWVELINDLNPGLTVHSTYMSSIRLLFVTETLADV